MASKKIFPVHQFLTPTEDDTSATSVDTPNFEFDESDIWNLGAFPSQETIVARKKSVSCSSRPSRKIGRKSDVGTRIPMSSSSLPVNVPDMSKIYKDCERECWKKEEDDGTDHENDDDDEEEEDTRVPPHEFLARRRGESFSVHEGRGSTLKVRNAVWKIVGFED